MDHAALLTNGPGANKLARKLTTKNRRIVSLWAVQRIAAAEAPFESVRRSAAECAPERPGGVSLSSSNYASARKRLTARREQVVFESSADDMLDGVGARIGGSATGCRGWRAPAIWRKFIRWQSAHNLYYVKLDLEHTLMSVIFTGEASLSFRLVTGIRLTRPNPWQTHFGDPVSREIPDWPSTPRRPADVRPGCHTLPCIVLLCLVLLCIAQA